MSVKAINDFTKPNMLSNEASEGLLEISKDVFNGVETIDPLAAALPIIEVDDRHGLIAERCESLAQGFYVVIVSAGGLASLGDAGNHSLFVGVHEQDERHVHRVPDHACPAVVVVLVSREAVNQEALGCPAVLLHAFLEKLTSDLNRDNFALDNALIDQGSGLGAGVSLPQISCD